MNPANNSLTHILLDVLKIGLSFFICMLLFFFTLFAYTKVAGPLPFSVNSTTTQKNDAFMVTGEGKAAAVADKATVRLGVTANGTSQTDAQQKLNEVNNKVIDAVKALGIPATDIKTEGPFINPTYDYSVGGNQKITGYNGSINLTINVKQTEKAEQIIDAGTKLGANNIGGVTFDTVDKTAAENEAREKAIADAKQKAEIAAKSAGFKLGKLLNYNESAGGGVMPMYAKDLRAGAGLEAAAPTQLEPGQNEVTVTVTLSYEIF